MKVLTSRVVAYAIMLALVSGASMVAHADPVTGDYKVVASKVYVDDEIAELSSHKVNGAPLSNTASYFYGEGVGAADTATKTVSIPSITGTPAVGQVIVVKPATTNTSSTININLNNTAAYSVLYRGSSSNIPKEAWTAYVPSIFVLDETSGGTKYWRYVGTSPVAMTWFATETTASNAYSTTFDGTTNNWPAADENKYIKGDSFAQGLSLKQNILPAKTSTNDDTTHWYIPIGGQTIALGTNAGEPDIRYITKGIGDSLTAKTPNNMSVGKYIRSTASDDSVGLNAGIFMFGDRYSGQKVEEALVSLKLLRGVYQELAIPKSGNYALGNTSTYTTGDGTADTDYLNALVKGTGLVTKTSNNGQPGERLIFEESAQTAHTGAYTDAEKIQIPTVGAMMSAISSETNSALPTGTAGTVVTYNGTNPQTGVQQFTETAIVDAPVYTNGNLTNGDSLPSVEYVENALDTKQPIIQPSTVSGKTQIVVKPAYGGTAGEVGYLTLDTSSLTVSSDSTVPSSKLLNTQLNAKYDLGLILDTDETDIYAGGFGGAPSWAATSGTENLYRIPGEVSGDNWAAKIMDEWATHPNVPTMDTLANSLAGLYDAVGDSINSQILDYDETGRSITNATIPVPSQIEYTGDRYLDDGTQLFWLPSLALAGNTAASTFLNRHTDVAPSMDELAYALDGLLQTHETTREWQAVAGYYGISPVNLYRIADMIRTGDTPAVNLNRSNYFQTFVPTFEVLMEESYALYQLIEQKQTKLSGPNGNLVTYGATPGVTGSKEIAITITDDADTVPNTAAVYNAVNARQNIIPVAGNYRSSNTETTDTPISDWTATDVKGTALVTKPTSSNGVVGERKIFEVGDTYTNDAATNIQIATIGAVMENTFTKTCAEYRPGAIGETAANCWLWEITGNTVTPACSANGTTCRSDSDCCSNYCNIARPSVCATRS